MPGNFNWKHTLAENEKVLYEFGISKTYAVAVLFVLTIVAIAVCFSNIFVGLAVFLLGLFYFLYLTKGKHFAFTDKRVVFVDSFLGKDVVSVDYSQITDIEIEQSPFDQLGGWGLLAINTAGTYAPVIRLSFINNPDKVKQELDKIRTTVHFKR